VPTTIHRAGYTAATGSFWLSPAWFAGPHSLSQTVQASWSPPSPATEAGAAPATPARPIQAPDRFRHPWVAQKKHEPTKFGPEIIWTCTPGRQSIRVLIFYHSCKPQSRTATLPSSSTGVGSGSQSGHRWLPAHRCFTPPPGNNRRAHTHCREEQPFSTEKAVGRKVCQIDYVLPLHYSHHREQGWLVGIEPTPYAG